MNAIAEDDSRFPNQVEIGFDRNEALARAGGDEDLLLEIVSMFLEDCPILCEDINKAITAKDSVSLSSAAHTLKGVLANFGSSNSHQSAQLLEAIGRAGEIDGASIVFSELLCNIERLKANLAALQNESIGK